MDETKKEKKLIILPSHLRVYNFIEAFIERKLYSPDVTEISKATKLHQRQVHRLVNDLIEMGHLTKQRWFKRSIQIIKPLS